MIDSLAGVLERKEPMAVAINVGGIGFLVHISLQTFDALPAEGSDVRLLTLLHVREDGMTLFGFLAETERTMFRLLQNISGIGPKMALNILSGCGPDQLREYVRTGNIGALTSVPGVGKKTAERIIVELKDKLGKGVAGESFAPAGLPHDIRGEALMALLALGYSRQIAEQAVFKAMQQTASGTGTSELIKTALKLLSS